TREFNEELKGISRMDSLEKILVLGGRQHDFTEEEKIALAEKKNVHYCRLIEGITPGDILPGIKELIDGIKAKDLKLGLASVSKNAFTVMDRLGLTENFDTIVDAAKIKKSKPDPEIFLTAASQLGVEPDECIGVEDAAAGVDSIKGAGMFAVGIGSKSSLAKADVIFERTDMLTFDEILTAYEK
ncbi:MAG: beta-phosphoglucomutase, partial [Bacillota bacterium]|nr:beta-phosphoglucomutase [Bacillota bacterium]